MRRQRKGAAAIEFSFVAPVMIAIFLAMVEYGFYFSEKQELLLDHLLHLVGHRPRARLLLSGLHCRCNRRFLFPVPTQAIGPRELGPLWASL